MSATEPSARITGRARTIDVLVVDDHVVMRSLIALMLEKFGLSARLVASPFEALAAVEARLPDLVLIDLMLPEMTGEDLAELLRGMGGMASVPLIAVTAVKMPGTIPEPFAGWLEKPFTARELYTCVSTHLARVDARQE